MKFKAYGLVSRAVEEAAGHVAHRMYKYSDHPSDDVIVDLVHHEVMLALDEIFDFGDGGE